MAIQRSGAYIDLTSGSADAAVRGEGQFDLNVALALSKLKDSTKPTSSSTKIADVMATGDEAAISRLKAPNLADISNTGVPLANIAAIKKITGNVLELTTRDGKVITIIKQITPYLFDGMSSKSDAVDTLNRSIADGYRIAQAGDISPGLERYANIGLTDELGQGLMRYETWSGDKVVVSREINSALYERVKVDGEIWDLIKGSQSDGYRLASSDEAYDGGEISGLSKGMEDGLIRYENASGDKVIISRDISPNLYDAIAKKTDGQTGMRGAVDTRWIDNSIYASDAKEWSAIVGNTDSAPTQLEKDLNRPRAASRMLADNWEKWGLQDRAIDFSNPPADLPPEALACLKYVSSSSSLMASLDVSASVNILGVDEGNYIKGDGLISRTNVYNFVRMSNEDVLGAASSYSKFLSKNPDATPVAKEHAKSAAILMGNKSLISNSGADALGNGKDIYIGNLDAIQGDSALSKSLTDSAGYWSSAGMFLALDNGGDHPATMKTDGVVQSHNFAAWLETQAPKNDHEVLMMIRDASVRNSAADVDTSTLTKDVLDHPEKYDGKTKTAVMMELVDVRRRMTASGGGKPGDDDLYSSIADSEYSLNPNKSKVITQLDSGISVLASDQDVVTFVEQNQRTGMRDIVSSSSAIKHEFEVYQDGQINNGNIISTSLFAKDAKGNPLPLVSGLTLAGTDSRLTDMALGGDGNVDLAFIAHRSGKSREIEQYFRENILSGKDLQDALGQPNVDPMAAAANFAAQAALFGEFLGDKISVGDASVVQQFVSGAISDALVDGASESVLIDVFGSVNGGIDETKVKDIIDRAMTADAGLFKDASGAPIASEDILSMMRGAWDVGRQGNKISDVLPKIVDGIKLDASDAYKQGLLHVGSALLAGGVLAVRSSTGGTTTAENSLRVSSGMQFAGLLMEGGSRYAKSAGYGMVWRPAPIDSSKPQLIGETPMRMQDPARMDNLGNIGKVVGGAGSLIGGVFSIISGVDAAFAGDKVNAGFSLTSGILGTGAAVASIIEGVGGLLGSSITAVAAGTLAGVLGWAAAGFGVVAAMVLPLLVLDQRDKQIHQFFDGLAPTLVKYGLTGGATAPEDEAPFYGGMSF